MNAARVLQLLLLLFATAAVHGQAPPMPPELQGIRSLRGGDFIDVVNYAEERSISRVTDIVFANVDGKPGNEFVLVGIEGVAVFPKGGNTLMGVIPFQEKDNTWIAAFDMNKDGVPEFLERGGDPKAPDITPRVFDIRGRQLWTTGSRGSVVGARPWHRQGPSSPPQFALARATSVELLDANGQRTGSFNVAPPIVRMELVDATGDGIEELVTVSGDASITVRDKNGEVLRRGKLPFVPQSLPLIRGPNNRGRIFLVMGRRGHVGLFNLDGTRAAMLEAPYCDDSLAGVIMGTPVKLVPEKTDYLALLVQYPAWERSILYVYNPEGQLVYMRCIPGYVTSLAAIPAAGDGTEMLFTGGNGNIYWNQVIGPAK